jgi:putative ABC transport system ATP-binding protein
MADIYDITDIRAEASEGDDDVIIRGENIHKTYLLGVEGVPALRGVSLSIKRGEFVVIYGLSGGGKTTLMNILGTIDKPTKGELYLCGHRIDSNTSDKVLSYIRLKKIGFVFQTFNLLSSLNAIENVELPMILDGKLDAQARRRRAQDLLDMVGIGERATHVPSQLSGGEQQRVTIARAMANKPDMLLLDEPTGDLDSENTCIVMDHFLKLNKEENITLVMITHDVSLKNMADRVIWMRDGKILKVEQVSQRKKEKRIRQLREEMEEYKVGKEVVTHKWKNTFLKKPEAYETHPDFTHLEEELVNFKKVFPDIESLSDITLEDYETAIGLPHNTETESSSSEQVLIDI